MGRRESSTNRIHSARAAKEFLVSKIVAQAQREPVPLSEVERKMLYFSETAWTLPDMSTISEEFDRVCDQDDYERKIADLIKRTYKRVLRAPGEEYDDWWSAIQLLNKEDHYLLVMVRLAGLRPRWDQLKLLGAALVVAALFVCAPLLSAYLARHGVDLGKYIPSPENRELLYWAIPLCLVAVYWLLDLLLGESRVAGFVGKSLHRLLRGFSRSR